MIAQILSNLSYHAVAVGPLDLAGGVEVIRETAVFGMPWVSLNLFDAVGNQIVPGWLTVALNEKTITVVGITASLAVNSGKLNYKVEDYHSLLSDAIDEISATSDMIIVLSTLSRDENEKIAKEYDEIALIVSAMEKGGNIPPYQKGNALITQTHSRGKYLGILTGEWSRKSGWQQINEHSQTKDTYTFKFRSLASHIRSAPDILTEINTMKKSTD